MAWLQRTDHRQLSTTVINLAEIQCGIERQKPSNQEYARGTQAWMERLLRDGSTSVWTLTLSAALILARMYETPSLKNFVLPDPNQKRPKSTGDLAVASIAIDQGAVVATRNVGHFEAINASFPLPGIYDPFCERWAVPSKTADIAP
jgi:predicted nucleic acid-binding protein